MLGLKNRSRGDISGYVNTRNMFNTELGHSLNKIQTDNMLKAVSNPQKFIDDREDVIVDAVNRAADAYDLKIAELDFLPKSEAHIIALELATSLYNDAINTENIKNPAFNTVITDNLYKYNGIVDAIQRRQAVGNNDEDLFKKMREEGKDKYLKKYGKKSYEKGKEKEKVLA